MNKEKEEYISLRQEIVELCSAADRIINILYLFLATYLCFVFNKEDTIYALSIHIVILPLYLLAIDRRIATCKISAYISVFHENEKNKWETRLINYKNLNAPSIFKFFSAKHFPFVFANCIGLILFICNTRWNANATCYDIVKIVVELLLFLLIMYIFVKHRKIQVEDYVNEWKNIKQQEINANQEQYEKFIKEMPQKIEEELFKEIIAQAQNEKQRTQRPPFD